MQALQYNDNDGVKLVLESNYRNYFLQIGSLQLYYRKEHHATTELER